MAATTAAAIGQRGSPMGGFPCGERGGGPGTGSGGSGGSGGS
ncbi:hypothetical protein ABZ958_15015 [Streptomyces sp. NPDC046237]